MPDEEVEERIRVGENRNTMTGYHRLYNLRASEHTVIKKNVDARSACVRVDHGNGAEDRECASVQRPVARLYVERLKLRRAIGPSTSEL